MNSASARSAERLHELFLDFLRVGDMLHPDDASPGHPVSVSQALALRELDTDRPLSQRQLGQRLHLEKSSVSRLAATMERSGLLVRERDPSNRRLYRMRLTDRGRALHASLAAAFHRHYLRWAAAMTPAERDALLVGLSAFVRVMREVPVPGHAHGQPDKAGSVTGHAHPQPRNRGDEHGADHHGDHGHGHDRGEDGRRHDGAVRPKPRQ